VPVALAFFEHVFDGWFIDHQIRGAAAVQLDAVLVVPLNIAVDFLAVAQHDDHGSLRLHLLLIVEVFGVGLFARRDLLSRSRGTITISVPISFSALGGCVTVAVVIVRVIVSRAGARAVEGGSDQLAIRKAFLVIGMTDGGVSGGLFGWYGF